jgi:hemerythrin-like domain-containing protein
MPIGPLMIEHRLMDRMIALMDLECRRLREGRLNLAFVENAVDFFEIYVDLCHHAKEERLLFKGLAGKKIPPGLKKTLAELLEEHERARKIVALLDAAKRRHGKGGVDTVSEMGERMKEMTVLYSAHIVKEDKHFFIPSMSCFSKAEQDAMLSEMREFDRQLIHEIYRGKLESFEKAVEEPGV